MEGNLKLMLNIIRSKFSKYRWAVLIKEGIEGKLGVSLAQKSNTHEDLENVDRKLLADKMIHYWTGELNVSERTARDWLAAAFNFDRYFFDVEEIKKRFG